MLVMALHFVNNAITPTNLFERAAVTITNYGLWGVDLFFVLSGFLITGILVESKNAPGYFRNFFVRRALRIFPLVLRRIAGAPRPGSRRGTAGHRS